MHFTTMQNKLLNALKKAAVLLLWLAVWQLAAAAVDKEILIPSPSAAFSALCVMLRTAEFWLAVLHSVLRICIGYLSGIFIGAIGGLLSYRFDIFRAIFSPILHLVRAVPVASFIILSLVWLKSSELPVFICFLMVLPIIWLDVESSMAQIDRKYIEMAKIYRFSELKILFRIQLPFILPSFAAAATTALGFAWKSGVAAEVICRPASSLGGMLQDAKLYLEIPDVFAITAVVAVLSLLLEQLMKKTVRRLGNDKNR